MQPLTMRRFFGYWWFEGFFRLKQMLRLANENTSNVWTLSCGDYLNLRDCIFKNNINERCLAAPEFMNNIFPDIDYRGYKLSKRE